MATRTSVEIQAGLCRVVEVDVDRRRLVGGEAPRAKAADIRVRRFVTAVDVDPDSMAFSRALRRLRRPHALSRRAVVTLWGLRSTHQWLCLPAAADADLAALAAEQAKEELALIEHDGSRARLAVARGAHCAIGDEVGCGISLTAASDAEIVRRVEPITRAGFIVDRVLTPAMALASVARGRAEATPGTPSMYVALAARATCVAVVKDGVLLMARELPWGHAGPRHADHAVTDDSFDQRLASELRRSLLCFRQSFRTGVEAIVLCGDMVGLRRLTSLLGAALHLPVHTLDSLAGIDAGSVPDPAAVFHDEVAALRLAIAAGAEPEPFASLASPAARWPRYPLRTPIAVAAAAAALLLLIAGGKALWQSRSRPAPMLSGVSLDVRVASTAPAELHVEPSVGVASESAAVESEIVVDSILFSADRRLAVVNGQIARAGDRIGRARIVEIQPRAVIVESAEDGRRSIEMRRLPPSSSASAKPRPSSERR